MRSQPFIKVVPKSSEEGWLGCFAISLVSCVTAREHAQRPEQFFAQRLSQQSDLIRSLHVNRDCAAFALRTIVRPKPDAYSTGTVEIAFLGRISTPDREAATRTAAKLCRSYAALLAGSMPDYFWQVVSSEARFESLWHPFEFPAADFAEIRRREELWHVSNPRGSIQLGRRAMREEQKPKGGAAILRISPFASHQTSMAALLRVLLLQDEPLLLQTILAPTELVQSEVEALEKDVAFCERLLDDDQRASSHSFGTFSGIHNLRVRQLRQALGMVLARLQQGSFQLAIQLASPVEIPDSVAQAVGVELVGSAAQADDSDGSGITAGGFEVVKPVGEDDARIFSTGLSTLTPTMWGKSKAPPPLRRIRYLVDALEAATVFRLPLATAEGLHGLETRHARIQPLPRDLATLPISKALMIGENCYGGARQAVALAEADRDQHIYVVGQTGTGKSTLLKAMALADIEAGHGLAVIDPHGDLFTELLRLIPAERAQDVVLLDPTDVNFPVGLNLLECQNPEDRHFIVREMRGIMERLLSDQYGSQSAHYVGPVFYQHMQMNLLLAMSDPQEPGTLLDFYEIFNTKDYWKRWIPLKVKDPQLQKWVNGPLSSVDYHKRGSDEQFAWGEYISSKFADFIFDPKLRLIFGQRRSTIDIRKIMDEGKILLVNLAKGTLSEANSKFFGMILMAKIQAAAMSRINQPATRRRKFYLYVDEFQSLATEGFILMLSEGRKFGLSIVLANQFISQIENERIVQSIFGNVGTLVAMRVGRADANLLEPYFAPTFDWLDLCNLPNWEAYVRTKYHGQALPPFSLRTILPSHQPDAKLAAEIKRQSQALYGRPREQLLKDLSNEP